LLLFIIYRMVYYCEICDYNTSKKYNYQRHLESKKHIHNLQNNTKSIENNTKSIEKKSKIFCEYCKKNISHKNNVKKHHRVCKEKIKHDIESNKDKIIDELKKEKEKEKEKIEKL